MAGDPIFPSCSATSETVLCTHTLGPSLRCRAEPVRLCPSKPSQASSSMAPIATSPPPHFSTAVDPVPSPVPDLPRSRRLCPATNCRVSLCHKKDEKPEKNERDRKEKPPELQEKNRLAVDSPSTLTHFTNPARARHR
ncbi:hypothetical protein M0R45_004547 [Rubus argutus]|uniref:Uncharacterized protein n=1 Tax=Rubus argutus TaxID=59490 RepID=A0AAW1YK18_RUBAR